MIIKIRLRRSAEASSLPGDGMEGLGFDFMG